MSTIVFISTTVPDKRLLKEYNYKYFPSPEMKEEILKEVEKHAREELSKYAVDIQITVTLKEYDSKYQPPDKNQCYQESSSTKTDV